MTQLDLTTRRRIILWYSKDFTIGNISRNLEKESTITSKNTLYLVLRKYKETSIYLLTINSSNSEKGHTKGNIKCS